MKKTRMKSIALTVLFYSTFLTKYYRERYIFSPKFNDDIKFFLLFAYFSTFSMFRDWENPTSGGSSVVHPFRSGIQVLTVLLFTSQSVVFNINNMNSVKNTV
jgi:hypothetical protein